ncbi:MAG: hypothetical protein QOK13_1265 [Gaiellaceae bacterium]|nr:hypothetical protein [Gaiellaceae bacterium]
MAGTTTKRRRRLGLLAILALAFATALLVQPFGYNQGAHYALVRALADGTPRIDAYRDFSGDIGYYKGHYYSNKAPGLAFVTLPVYEVAHAVGLPSGVHVLSLWGVLLPGILLLLLVWRVGDRAEPGYGFAAAFTLGIATLVLPFLGMYFAHILSALLGFAAFALLWWERDGPRRLWLVAAAGFLAGFAVVVEYPLALTAVVLGCYAISRKPVLERGLVWTGGVFVGLLPLLAFNRWAFGSFTQLSYSHLVVSNKPGGPPIVYQPTKQAFQPRVAVELLLSPRGLLTLAPIVAVGIAGAVFLYRRRRAEALTIGAIAGLFLLYNTAFIYFGGFGPGPRYLIPALPFAAVGLAAAYRRLPVTTLALAAVSAGTMLLATVTEPLLPNNEGPGIRRFGDVAHPSHWLDRLRDGSFTDTVFAHAGLGHGWLSIGPVLVVVLAAVALAAASLGRLEVARRDAECAAVAFAGWLVALLAAPELLHHDRFEGGVAGVWTVVALLFALVLACVATSRGGPARALPAVLLVALPFLRDRPVWALGVALLALALLAARSLPPRRMKPA